ncbi:MAG: HDIG domain-containing protein [Candidatus Hydrogenedens sp.]|nr:HDIG domain-containing protein [Candidatus Hydrogenedens sp.]
MDRQEAAARTLCKALRAAGHTAYLAGGCVRDRLLGVRPKDYDIATSAMPDEIANLFSRTVGVGAAFGVMLVITDAGPIEVATFRTDGAYSDGRRPESIAFADPEADASRRDFTINALFLDPETEAIIDYVGGREDLARGIIRTVGDAAARFGEDHLRLLRAIRFAARLGYEIEAGTAIALREKAASIVTTSAERIRDELVGMFTGPRPGRALHLLDEYGLLRHVLPEVAAMKGVEQPPEYHPEGDVFIHTALVLDALYQPSAALAFGALLHDVGKPSTITYEDRIRFNGHPEVGADMARRIARRLKFSNDESDRIVWLVAMHMRVACIPDMREAKRKRLVRTEGFDELLALCLADCRGSLGDVSTIAWILEYLAELPLEAARPPRLVNGSRLIELGYAPGPEFKAILAALEDAQLEGEIASVSEAERWLAAHYPRSA